jgi:hypothetical protein
MSTPSPKTQLSERDSQVVSAMRRAIRSMELVDGLVIHIQDMTGHLSFGHDIDRLNEALVLMGADPHEAPAEPPAEPSAPATPPSPRQAAQSNQGMSWTKWLSRLIGA